jgi:hypothetical protein
MYKNFNLTESEKEQILEMHQSHGYKKPLNETKIYKLNLLNEEPVTNINPKNLKIGDGGKKNPQQVQDVKKLQQYLIDAGLLKTTSGKPTGYFGPLTNAALNSYLSGGKQKTPIQQKTSTQPNSLAKSIESSSNVEDLTGSDRINKEIMYINARPQFNGKPFFLVDPKLNIVYAYDANHKFVAYSQSVAGADKQKERTITYKEWCEISGLKYDKFARLCKGQEIATAADSAKTKNVTPSYDALIKTANRYAAAGIYKTTGVYYEKGYQGIPSVPNLFSLEAPDGSQIGTAIHALVNIPNRLVADAELKKYLDTEKNLGRIPKKYIDAVTKFSSKYDLSSGCFNVDPKFANNPSVIAIARSKAFVFIMSEKNKDYLVVVPPSNHDEFFMALKGDGQSCKPIESIASNLGSTLTTSSAV